MGYSTKIQEVSVSQGTHTLSIYPLAQYTINISTSILSIYPQVGVFVGVTLGLIEDEMCMPLMWLKDNYDKVVECHRLLQETKLTVFIFMTILHNMNPIFLFKK